jgi:hypothetical protein
MHRDKQVDQQQSHEEVLWRLADEMRASGPRFSLEALIKEAKKRGVPVSWAMVSSLRSRLSHYGFGPAWLPAYVSRFIVAYLQGRKVNRMVDPFAGYGALLIPIANACDVQEAIGIDVNQEFLHVAKEISEALPIRWHLGRAEDSLPQYSPYDLVVSAPPLGLPSDADEFVTPDGPIRLRDSKTYLLILRACLGLTNDGEVIFILPNGFFWSPTLQAFSKLGFFVHAVFALPARVLAPYTNIDLNVVIIKKQPKEKWFVGQVDPNGENEALLKNFREATIGPVIALGRMVAPSHFTSWQSLIIEEEIEKLTREGGLQAVSLSAMVSEINLGKRSEDGDLSDKPNSVYLPVIGTSPAVTSLAALRIKPQNCVQLVVRPEAAFAEFVAGMFNSVLGRKIRDRLLRGAFIPKITKESLQGAAVYLPPLETQRVVVDVHREMKDLQLRLADLEQGLWNRPVDALKVRQTLSSLSQKESLESWLESLPFPLASVLWRYHAAAAPEQKVTHLFNFFEACAMFVSTVMLSAFHSNAEYFRENKRLWHAHSLERSNFGDWVARGQRLAETTRKLLGDEQHIAFCLGLYKTESKGPAEALSNKDLFVALANAKGYRNDWKGHGGIADVSEHARRLTLLEAELTRVHEALRSVFEDWWLIRPGKSDYSRGLYNYVGDKLLGSRQIFKEVEIQTSTVMDKNELYLIDTETRDPLQLLPFFRMLSGSPAEKNACYFYSRLQTDGIRWVSYHYEPEAEIIRVDEVLPKVINEIEH